MIRSTKNYFNSSSDCLVLSAIPYMPFLMLSDDPKTAKITGGTMLEVFKLLSQYMGFCYRYEISTDYAGGLELPNGSWTGVIGKILTGQADMAAVALAVTAPRAKAVDFSEFLYDDEWTATYARPSLEADIAGFIKPYDLSMWLITMASLVVSVGAMFFVRTTYSRIQQYWQNEIHDEKSTAGPSIINESCIWTLGTFLSQSVPRQVNGLSVRLITCFWILAAFIITNVYRCNLKAMLILPKVTLPFTNLDELVESGLPVWVPVYSVLHLGAKNAPRNTSLGRLYNQFVKPDDFVDVAKALRGVHAKQFVITGPRTVMEQVTDQYFSKLGYCSLYVMPGGMLKQTLLSLFFRKGSPLKAKFDPVIMRLKETGIFQNFYKKAVANATECLKPIALSPGSSTLRPIGLEDFYGVFMIYGGGIFIALLTFIIEIFTARNSKGKLSEISG
ncbi:glutamate receptor ionotropic, delta-2-like [Palaemon carinicauda]|uniref:glutamate receptor ionotropic, delta-2-like n=1 Tax=Palaemon carinicauda TaxID=392227 RepID=UPI0035B5F920